jgi:hypothetical protein
MCCLCSLLYCGVHGGVIGLLSGVKHNIQLKFMLKNTPHTPHHGQRNGVSYFLGDIIDILPHNSKSEVFHS